MIKPLLRTIPTLSGNVKLACTLLDYNKINKDTFETNIRGAHIYPLSSQLFQKSVQANLLNSSWEYDLKRFYSAYSDTFFEPCFDVNKSEMPLLDKTSVLYPRNTDFEYGVKRISYSKSGCQYAFFAPIYIDNVNDIPAYFNIKIKLTNRSKSAIIYKTIRVNIGINGQDDHNYIYKYLSNYLNKIDNNVIYMNNDNESILYYGIDLIKGGFTKFEDSSVSTLFNTKLPIQLFDYTISEGFKRNQICMRQCLPLCFYFNVDEILTNTERARFAYGDLEFSGEYVLNNGTVLNIYDFSTDYDNFAQDILALNTANGVMQKINGNITNIMDIPFPSFSDKWIVNYQFANKLSKTFNRWKLKYSTDENPYITNMSWAFSKNQNNNYKYSIFPTNYTNQSAFAEINNENKYNLVLPLGKNIAFYDKLNPLSASKYEAIMNNYCVSWFDVISSDIFESFKDTINWADVDNGYTYYNGILYNLNYIYDRISLNEKKIDKFAFLVYPDTENIKNESYFKNDIKYVSNILTYNTTNVHNTEIYNNILNKNSEVIYDIYENNKYEETSRINLSFNGMLKQYEYNTNIPTSGVYIKTNDIVYSLSTISGQVIKTKNYYDINTIYSVDLVDDKINALYNTTNTWVTTKNENGEVTGFSSTISNAITALGISIDELQGKAIDHIVLQYDNLVNNLDADPIPELFDASKIGAELFEILPAYKGNMYYSILNNTNYKDFYINDNKNEFNPRPLDGNVDTTNNSLFTSYGIQLLKKTRFFDIAWLQYIRTRVSDNCFTTYTDVDKESVISSFKSLYEDICNKCIQILNSIDTNSDNYIGHLYYPELNYNENIIANNVAIIKQNHFDTSIEDTVYTEEMDDNVLYMHPFNIENIVKSFENKINEEINNIQLYDKLVLSDIIYEKTVDENTEKYIINKYNIANLIIGCTDNVNNYVNGITKEYIFTNFTDETLYQLNTHVQYITINNNNNIICYLPNGNIDTTVFISRTDLNNIISRINTLVDEKNNDLISHLENLKVDMYNTLNINFRKMRAILNSLEMVNMFMHSNNTNFMECSAFTSIYPNKIIPQNFYKQTKCFDNNGNIKFKLDIITQADTNIKFNKENGLFYTVTEDDNGNEIMHEFNIVVETDFIKLNKELFDYSNVANSNNGIFNDIYLFRPLTDIEYDDKYVNTVINFDNNAVHNTSVLYPCFNSIFEEDKQNTLYFKNFVLNNITEVHHTPIKTYDINLQSSAEYKDTFYRYNVDNTSLVIEVLNGNLPKNRIKSITGNDIIESVDKTPIYTEEFKNENIGFITDNNSSVFNKFNLLVKDVDNIRYGYYLLKVKIDNSRNIFNIRGILDNTALSTSNFAEYIPNIKYITYINGIDINENRSYIKDIFKQLCPFLYINLLELAADTNTIMLPKIFNLHNIYSAVTNNDIGAKEQSLVFTKTTNNKTTITQLQRYTNSIIPYLYKVDTPINIYNYKYKDVQKMLLNTGKFASIGDIVFDSSFSTINNPLPLNIYTSNNDINISDYNKIVNTYLPTEYKYFNNSKMINFDSIIKLDVKKKLTYIELLDYQSEQKTIDAFKNYISKYNFDETNEDLILFLYKKYSVQYDTIPDGVFADGKTKAYKMTYIFNLL